MVIGRSVFEVLGKLVHHADKADGAAYRLVTKKGVTVKEETAEFRFPGNHRSWVRPGRDCGRWAGE